VNHTLTQHSFGRLPTSFATIGFLGLAVVCLTVPGARTLAAAAMAVLAMISGRYATVSLVVLLLLRMLNPALSGQEEQFVPVAWAATFLAASRIWWAAVSAGAPVASWLPRYWLGYAVATLALTLWSSEPYVSALKALTYFYVTGALILGVAHCFATRSPFARWPIALWASVAGLSAVVLAFPDVAYFRDGQGFQGALNHPQALAVFLAPLAGWLLGRAVQTGFTKPDVLVALAGTTTLLFLTKARTGPASLLLGALLLLILRDQLGHDLHLVKRVLKSPTSWLVITLIAVSAPFIAPKITQDFQEYLFKSALADDVSGAFEESRGFIIAQALINIEKNPLFGIGFGVAVSDTHEFKVDLNSTTGLPVSAATEKANLPLAVLEETGIIGTIFFALFFSSLLKRISNASNLPVALCALTAICTNISEMTFFSMGGLGLYTWILIAWALSLSMSSKK
jgi:O-Antigen ligase